MRKGIKNVLPASPDGRRPLLLPLVMHNQEFDTPTTEDQRLLKFATIMGFLGMMRPHSLVELRPESFRIVSIMGNIYKMPSQPQQFYDDLFKLLRKQAILGFYVEFRSKTKERARAHFPYLSNVPNEISRICPVRALVDIAQRDGVRKNFLKDLNKNRRLTRYLQNISGVEQDIAPYALRIGGRTWFLANGLDRQFVDFLGVWKSPEAAARYFRAAPKEVLRYLTTFLTDLNV